MTPILRSVQNKIYSEKATNVVSSSSSVSTNNGMNETVVGQRDSGSPDHTSGSSSPDHQDHGAPLSIADELLLAQSSATNS